MRSGHRPKMKLHSTCIVTLHGLWLQLALKSLSSMPTRALTTHLYCNYFSSYPPCRLLTTLLQWTCCPHPLVLPGSGHVGLMKMVLTHQMKTTPSMMSLPEMLVVHLRQLCQLIQCSLEVTKTSLLLPDAVPPKRSSGQNKQVETTEVDSFVTVSSQFSVSYVLTNNTDQRTCHHIAKSGCSWSSC